MHEEIVERLKENKEKITSALSFFSDERVGVGVKILVYSLKKRNVRDISQFYDSESYSFYVHNLYILRDGQHPRESCV